MITCRDPPGRCASTRASTLVPRRVPAAKRVSAWLWTGRTNRRIGRDGRRPFRRTKRRPIPRILRRKSPPSSVLPGRSRRNSLYPGGAISSGAIIPTANRRTNVIAQARALLSPTPFMIERGANSPGDDDAASFEDFVAGEKRGPVCAPRDGEESRAFVVEEGPAAVSRDNRGDATDARHAVAGNG